MTDWPTINAADTAQVGKVATCANCNHTITYQGFTLGWEHESPVADPWEPAQCWPRHTEFVTLAVPMHLISEEP